MTDSFDGPVTASVAGEALLALLESRRSASVSLIGDPGPSEDQLARILAIAARAPDHGMLEPWRFIVVDGEARVEASARLAECYAIENAGMEESRLQKFRAVMARIFTASPVVVIVVSRADPGAKIPVFEQELSAGAVCMNLLTSARAFGFDAAWVTGFAASSPGARSVLGVAAGEKIAGIIYIGTAAERTMERKRPNLEAITTRWSAA